MLIADFYMLDVFLKAVFLISRNVIRITCFHRFSATMFSAKFGSSLLHIDMLHIAFDEN